MGYWPVYRKRSWDDVTGMPTSFCPLTLTSSVHSRSWHPITGWPIARNTIATARGWHRQPFHWMGWRYERLSMGHYRWHDVNKDRSWAWVTLEDPPLDDDELLIALDEETGDWPIPPGSSGDGIAGGAGRIVRGGRRRTTRHVHRGRG